MCSAQIVSTADAVGVLSFSRKRITPAITGSAVGTFDIVDTDGAANCSGFTYTPIGLQSVAINASSGAAVNDGEAARITRDGTDNTFVKIDARL